MLSQSRLMPMIAKTLHQIKPGCSRGRGQSTHPAGKTRIGLASSNNPRGKFRQLMWLTGM